MFDHGCACLCIVTYGCVRLCTVACGRVCLCMFVFCCVYGNGWLYMFKHVKVYLGICVVVCACLLMLVYTCLWLCRFVFTCVVLCMVCMSV